MATIRDVAKYAGVSVATVSRVLNQLEGVSEQSKIKVNEAILALKYTPFHDSINTSHYTVMAVIPHIITDFQSRLLDALQWEAKELDMELLISICHNDDSIFEMCVSRLQKRSVHALLMLGTNKSAVELNALAANYPICICADYIEGINFLSFVSDIYHGTYDAVTEVIKKGFHKLAMISTATRAWSSLQKEAAYRQALEDNGIPVRPEYIYYGHFTQSGEVAYRYFEGLTDPPNGIFAISDYIASTIVIPIIKNRHHIGVDYALLGFDDTMYSTISRVPITTVAQDLDTIGRTTMQKISEVLHHPSQKRSGTIVVPSIVKLRESTGHAEIKDYKYI